MKGSKKKERMLGLIFLVVCGIIALCSNWRTIHCDCSDLSDAMTFPTRVASSEEKEKVTKEDPVTEGFRSSDHPLNLIYHSQPDEFVKGLSSCMLDPLCHILYQHVGKTGGTGMERLFFKISGNISYYSCCGKAMLNRFRNHAREYCLYPFSSYQVIHGFDEIVHTCNETFYDERHQFTILTSLREPIARTLSDIHQRCNKNWFARDARTKEACTACSFNQDEEYWLQTVPEILKADSTVMRQAMGSLKEFNHYWVDMLDLNTMIRHVQAAIHPRHQEQFEAYFNAPHNPEALSRCEFSMHSKMIKALQPSTALYRNFTRGIISS